jgi:hypothetical protein
MEIKATLKVINQASVEGKEGVIPEQSMKRLVGCPEVPSDRIRVGLASYKPGAIEALHWHPIEAFYFVLSGHATVRDYEGKEYEVGPAPRSMHRRASPAPTSGKSRKACRYSRCAPRPNRTGSSSSRWTRRRSARISISKIS